MEIIMKKTLFLIFALGVFTTNSYAWCPKGQVNIRVESMLFEDEGFRSLAIVASDGQSFNFRWGEHGENGRFWICAIPGETIAFTLFKTEEAKSNSANSIEQIACGNAEVHDDLSSIQIINVYPGEALSMQTPLARHKEPEYLKSNKSKCFIS
jgi:hypothetical protein